MLPLRRQMLKQGPACAPVRPTQSETGLVSLPGRTSGPAPPCVWVWETRLRPTCLCMRSGAAGLGADVSPPLPLPIFSSL